MPKLKFKEHDDGGASSKKKSNKKKKHHRSKSPSHGSSSKKRRHEKHRYYDPPKIYEDEPGWTPPPQDPDAEWRERLFSAMADDEGYGGGGDAFYSQYDEAPAMRMNDEEYREYIMNGMFRKKHAEEIAQEEARAAAAARREREREEAQDRLRKEHARMIEEQQRQEAALRRLRAQDSRTEYEARWAKLEEAKTILSKSEIPWPVCPGVSLTAEHVKDFVLSSKKDQDRKTVRKEQLRYHPDKFSHRVLAKFGGNDKDKARLHEKANEVSGWLNEIWQTLQ